MATNSRTVEDNDIVGAIISIMETDDNGPSPALKMRKRRNGAEQFYADYHAEYETRCNESMDKVSRVKNHNTAYPKLHDELGKKKSITKVTTIDGRKFAADFDPRCSACARLMTLSELQKKNVKYKCCHQENNNKGKRWSRDSRSRDRRSRDMKYRDRKSRISKKKSNSISKTWNRKQAILKMRISRSCQYSSYILVQDKKMGTSQGNLNVIKKLAVRSSEFCPESNIRKSQCKPSDHSQKISNPGSKVTTISSYNSYPSIDHEPMVTS